MTDKKSLKTKFRQAEAKGKGNGRMLTSIGGIGVSAIGLPLAFFIDGGATLAVGATMMGTGLVTSIPIFTINFEDESYKEKSFTFGDTKYFVSENQWFTLMMIEKKVKKLEKRFEESSNEAKRLKINTKIQTLVDHQKDILTSDNISTIDPKEQKKSLPKLSIDRKIGRGN